MQARKCCNFIVQGIYGCKWKSQENEEAYTKLSEKFWWWFFLLVFLLTVSFLFCWSVFSNDYNDFEWFIYDKSGIIFTWGILILIVFVLAVFYLALIFTTGVILIATQGPRHLHLCHKISIFPICIMAMLGYILVDMLWNEEFGTAVLAWYTKGPFLHIVMLVALTSASWLMLREIMMIENVKFWIAANAGLFCLMLFICLIPLTIKSPCLGSDIGSRSKPLLFGHRGGYTKTAPENTVLSYERANSSCDVFGIESDVRISYDGIPFLMHDKTLIRTTNVKDIFSNRSQDRAETFTWEELQQLDAGSWFLEQDPYHTVKYLSKSEEDDIKSQKIMSLENLAHLAAANNHSIIFDIFQPPTLHPFHNEYINLTMDTLLNSGLKEDSVLWLPKEGLVYVHQQAPGFHLTSAETSIEYLLANDIEIVNLNYNQQRNEDIEKYRSNNISVLQYKISTPWLFSVAWCQGSTYVTTGDCKHLKHMTKPIWILTPSEYMAIWISCDIIALVVLAIFFKIQFTRTVSASPRSFEHIPL